MVQLRADVGVPGECLLVEFPSPSPLGVLHEGSPWLARADDGLLAC